MKSLTTNGITQLIQARTGSSSPIYVQILHFQRFIPDEEYKSTLQIADIGTELEAFDLWLSDGKVQEKCTVNPKYNRLFTSGEILKYSIIQIIKSRVILLENHLTQNEVLIVDEMKLVDRLVTGTIHTSPFRTPSVSSASSTPSTTSSSTEDPPFPTPSVTMWTDPSVPYARVRPTKGEERVRDLRPLVGGRHYYVCEFCDDPSGPLSFLPQNPHSEEEIEEDENGDSEEGSNEEDNNKLWKKPYRLSPIFNGDIVAAGDFDINSRLEVASVCKKNNQRKKKKVKQEPPTLVGVISSKSSILSYGATSDIAAPMKFSITLSDTTGSITVLFWNAMCRYFQFLEVGQVVALRNFVVKKQYGGDGLELAMNVSNPSSKIYKLKRRHFIGIPIPRINYHFLSFTEIRHIPDGQLIDCVGVIVSRSASERRRIPSHLPLSPTTSIFYQYSWITLLNPPSPLTSSGEGGFKVKVATNGQWEQWNSLAVGQIVVLTSVRVASVTVDSIHPRLTYGSTTMDSRLYQIEGPYSSYVPCGVRDIPEVQQVVDWYGMGGWDDSTNAIEDYTPHYIWYPTLPLYCLNIQTGVLALKPFSSIAATKASLKLKERSNILVQCNVVGIQETSMHFVVKVQDLNHQHPILEVTVPQSILRISSEFYELPPSSSLLYQLQRFMLGEDSAELSTIQDLVDDINGKVFVIGFEVFCSAWKEFSVDACCFYSPNT